MGDGSSTTFSFIRWNLLTASSKSTSHKDRRLGQGLGLRRLGSGRSCEKHLADGRDHGRLLPSLCFNDQISEVGRALFHWFGFLVGFARISMTDDRGRAGRITSGASSLFPVRTSSDCVSYFKGVILQDLFVSVVQCK